MNLEETVVVGIDNGLKGGAVVLDGADATVLDTCALPVLQDPREIDVLGLLQWITSFDRPALVGLEEPLKHAKSSQAIGSMNRSYGLIKGGMPGYLCL